ncbi:MAG TPA: TetR family transcriptional regulator C-terminal domain-containing protein [Solidesulfovibrio magneticus]|nr:TetR family transcriptional regulator C-terminal domain-containing protein [Solidesulfovibrio magneticus]
MNETARERIIRAGAAIMHGQGYAATGLKEILDAAGAPKGSFYHYFPSKEAFALAVIEHYEAMLGELGRPALTTEGLTCRERLALFVARYRETQAEGGFRRGCPIGNLVLEMAGQSEVLGKRLAVSLAGLTRFFERLVAAGQASGEIEAGLDAAEAAGFLAGAWQGALMRMKAARNDGPLATFETFAARLLFGA